MSIEIIGIEKKFKDYQALKDINLNINSGELIALLGPSGSGKTTLLRIIAGLEYQNKGKVLIKKELLNSKPADQRSIGFVFQHYALFKHMTVFENVAFGMRVVDKKNRLGEQEINEKVSELLRLVQIEKLYNHYPHELSGGQRQRVALARSLAVEPEVLLLDEPFGALDSKVRKDLRRWLRKLHENMNITSIFVTHDQEEAMEVADRVVILNNGQIEQVGTPEEVYLKPANAFVYDFLGNFNVFEGYKSEKGEVSLAEYIENKDPDNNIKKQPQASIVDDAKSLLAGLFTNRKTYRLVSRKKRFVRKSSEGKPVKIFARPHEIQIAAKPSKETMECTVSHINSAGSLVKIELEREINNSVVQAEITRESFESLSLAKGDKVYISLLNKTVFE